MPIKEKDKNKHMIKMKRNKRGFTLGEMVTTVAIIGTITAISVPNYMRVRMQVNMEMVKQHLKTIGTHMNDVYNRDRQFPQNINQLGNSGEEIAITASLFGINRREYTTDGYTTGPNLSTFQLRTCPQAGRWGIAGDRCFVLTPLGISEDSVGTGVALNPWDGTGKPMEAWAPSWISINGKTYPNAPELILTSKNLTGQEQIELLTNFFVVMGYSAFAERVGWSGTSESENEGAIPSLLYTLSKESQSDLTKLMPEIYQQAQKAGLSLYVKEKGEDSIKSYGAYYPRAFSWGDVESQVSKNPDLSIYEMGFETINPSGNWQDFQELSATTYATLSSSFERITAEKGDL